MRGLRHVPCEERLRQLLSLERRRLRADPILAFKNFKGEVDINPPEFFLRTPRAGLRWHTYRLLQGPSRLFCPGGEILEQTSSTPSLGTFRIYLQKQLDRHWFEIFPATPDNFPNTVSTDFLCFLLTPNIRFVFVVIIGPRGHSYHQSINIEYNIILNIILCMDEY